MRAREQYLRAVEQRLRCPLDRRDEVMEELAGHLEDRQQALDAAGVPTADAETQAVREMGAAWWLALRLSAANGWNVTAHVLRELWAASIGLQLVMAIALALDFANRLDFSQRFAQSLGRGMGEAWGTYVTAAVLVGCFAVAWGLGRRLRSPVWAIVTALALPGPIFRGRPAVGTAVGLSLIIAALGGMRFRSTRPVWPVAALSLLLAGGLAVAGLATTPGLGGIHAVPYLLADIVRIGDAPIIASVLLFPWLFWAGAKVIERAMQPRLVQPTA